MTSLICWAGVDSRVQSSLYLASDSRLSKSHNWDRGRKLFACRNSPDTFGYCGAVLFPALVIGQLVEAIDSGLLFPDSSTPQERLQIVVDKIREALPRFPEAENPFSIAYATRSGSGFGVAAFFVAMVSWDPATGVLIENFSMPSESALIFAFGSGAKTAKNFDTTWKASDIGRTSRAVFSAFCEAIESGKDRYSGGPPQVVGIFQRGSAQTFGVVSHGLCHFHGMPLNLTSVSKIVCRNHLFEVCDAAGRVTGAKHARPRMGK